MSAAGVSSCCVWGRPYDAYESDTVMPVDPASMKGGVADENGFIDEKTCARACAGSSGELRHCRFTSKEVVESGTPTRVGCYFYPEDGSKERLTHKVVVTEEQRQSFPVNPDGTLAIRCYELCSAKPGQQFTCKLEPGRAATSSIQPFVVCHMYNPSGCGEVSFGHGRAPEGLHAPRRHATLGGYFAHAAYLERASVKAFRVLAAELGSLGAPRRLARRARAAARDELRHARVMTAFARRHGASVERVRSAPVRARTLFEVARENAVEGCVNETFGALMAMLRARQAADPELRRAMTRIAEDELRHAALAWSVHAWCEQALSPDERRAIRESMRAAVTAIAESALAADVLRALIDAQESHGLRLFPDCRRNSCAANITR